jgi:PadR family transcriptional regulator, regulatory protein PadR
MSPDTPARLTKDLIAASAAPLVLAILAEEESYGYAILQRVRELSGGRIEWAEGMLYPVLHRLEERGLIRARWRPSGQGPPRKVYGLNRDGRRALDEARGQWELVSATLERAWGPGRA